MKIWQTIFNVVLVIVALTVAIFFARAEPQECCLCDSFRYHAPCLIDLETGDMIELSLYMPHETKVAELAEEQPEMDTFSFVCLGNVKGTKMSARKIIELKVPTADKSSHHALCKGCRKQLEGGYEGRYVIADLYDLKNVILVPIVDDVKVDIRCYEIAIRLNEEMDVIVVTIQGNLGTIQGDLGKG